jgi:hypothetical protein
MGNQNGIPKCCKAEIEVPSIAKLEAEHAILAGRHKKTTALRAIVSRPNSEATTESQIHQTANPVTDACDFASWEDAAGPMSSDRESGGRTLDDIWKIDDTNAAAEKAWAEATAEAAAKTVLNANPNPCRSHGMSDGRAGMGGSVVEFVCSASDHGKRIFHALASPTGGSSIGIQSSKQAKKLLKQGNVFINGTAVEATRRVSEKDVIGVRMVVASKKVHSHTELANQAVAKRAVVRRQLGTKAFKEGVGNGLRVYKFYFPFDDDSDHKDADKGTDSTECASSSSSPPFQALLLPPRLGNPEQSTREVGDHEIVEAIMQGECACRMGEVRRHFSCSYHQARRALETAQKLLGKSGGGDATATKKKKNEAVGGDKAGGGDVGGSEKGREERVEEETEEEDDEDDKMVAAVARRFDDIVALAPSFPLHPECQDCALVEASLPKGWGWEALTQFRIRRSYERQISCGGSSSSGGGGNTDGAVSNGSDAGGWTDLLWLDDKLEQVGV